MKKSVINKIGVLVIGILSLFLLMPEVKAKSYNINDMLHGIDGFFSNTFEVEVGDELVLGSEVTSRYFRIYYATKTSAEDFHYVKIIPKEEIPEVLFVPSYEEAIGESLPSGKKLATIEAGVTVGCGDADGLTLTYILTDDESKEIVYHNTYDAENNNPLTYYVGETTILLNDIQREGYRFLGWYTSPTFEEETRVTMISSDEPEVLELYARWEEIEEEEGNIFTNPETRTMLYVGIGIAIVVILGTVLVVLYRKKKNHEKED